MDFFAVHNESFHNAASVNATCCNLFANHGKHLKNLDIQTGYFNFPNIDTG